MADNLVLNTYGNKPFARRLHPPDPQGRRAGDRAGRRATTCARRASTPRSPRCPGGNQQKVIIARELSGEPRLLIVAQPTRGLDVGSIEFIHHRIVEMRDAGAAVLLVSAELDEIFTLADRVGVLYRGRMVGVVPRAEASRDTIGYLMATGHDAAADTDTTDTTADAADAAPSGAPPADEPPDDEPVGAQP